MTQPRPVGGRYELGELIGYGGMAEVHRGRDVRLGRDVAIKVLRADLARDPSFLNRFRREAQSAAGLNHPSIVSVYDTGEDLGNESSPKPYIVMEFVRGRTLREILKAEGRLPARRAMEIAADVAAALDFSHRAGLIHRDVKPANVMITQTGAVKVMDFGIARAVADTSATVTQTANVIGTAQYLSPEQARGEVVDPRSDVYSLGCLLYELATGVPPFQGDSPVAVAYQHVRENATAPSTRVVELPRALDSIVMKALAKNPQNRYQTAAEMRSDLQRALANQAVSAESVMTDAERTQFIARTPAPPVVLAHADSDHADDGDHDRRNGVIWAAIVAALLLVLGVGAFLVYKLGSDTGATTKVTVPNLVGLTVTQADKRIAASPGCAQNTNCSVTLQPSGTSPTTPGPCDDKTVPDTEGVICTVTDQAGVRMAPNAQVDDGTTLVYQTYLKATATVPYVIGVPYADAVKAIEQAGLHAKQGKDVNTVDQAKGNVVSQNPAANKTVSPDQVVILRLSTGKVVLPDVRGQKSADARSTLNRAQFTNVTITKGRLTPDQAKVDTVYDMNPTPKIAYSADQKIEIFVYRYRPPAPTCDPAKTPSPTSSSTTSTPAPSGSSPATPSTSPSSTASTPAASPTNTLPPCG